MLFRQISPRRALLLELCVLGVGQTLIALAVKGSGFSAISDDDYARVVIAQDFAQSFLEHPTLDPSGTSWLPVPFLFYGIWFSVAGTSLTAARAGALLFAFVGTVLLSRAGKQLGLSRPVALGAALSAALLPYSAWLECATVPEYPVSAALVFAACSFRGANAKPGSPSLSWPAGVALFLSCGSRYEAWPMAFALGGFALWSRPPSLARLGPACLALLFPLIWLLHGALSHGDPVFFVARVSSYKAALGGPGESALSAVAHLARALVFAEPEAALACLFGVGALVLFLDSKRWPLPRARLLTLFAPFLVLFVALALGAVRGGAPTHHPERSFVPFWLLSVLLCARIAEDAWTRKEEPRLRLQLVGAMVLGLVSGVGLRCAGLYERAPFAEREEEERIGRFVGQKPGLGTVSLATPDYGYLAIQAASGTPQRFRVLLSHDPRKQEEPLDDVLTRTFQEKKPVVVPAASVLPEGYRALLQTPRLKLIAP